MKKLFLIVILLLLFLPIPLLTKADGGVFPSPEYWVEESDQKAVIYYNSKEQKETLVLSITFRGNAKDFAWVVPTPARPTIDYLSNEIFTALSEVTKVQYPVGQELDQFNLKLQGTEGKVTVVETKEVGIYDVTVLTSDDENALANWLRENNYDFPLKADYILEDYIKNNWYFVCAKIRSEALDKFTKEKLRGGHISPLVLEFQSSQIIYPLKISSVIQYQEPIYRVFTEEKDKPLGEIREELPAEKRFTMPPANPYFDLNLYIISDSEVSIPGFDTLYADEIAKDEIEKLAFDKNNNSWIACEKDKKFLTQITRKMKVSEIDSDLVLREKEKEEKPQEIREEPISIPLWQSYYKKTLYFLLGLLLWVISPCILIFILAISIQSLVQSSVVKKFLYLFVILGILGVISGVMFFLGESFNILTLPTSLNQDILEGVVWSGMSVLVGMLIVVLIRIRKKNEKLA